MTPSAPPRLTLVISQQPELIILGGGEAKKGGNCPTTRVNARFRAQFIKIMRCLIWVLSSIIRSFYFALPVRRSG